MKNATVVSRIRIAMAILGLVCLANAAHAESALSQLFRVAEKERSAAVQKLIQAGTPIVTGNRVLFLARQRESRPPRLLGDFNWFGRYPDAPGLAGGEMVPLAGTDWFFFETHFEADARIEYVFGADRRTVWLDPHNRKSNNTFGSENSVLEMPAYHPSPWLPADDYQLRGALHDLQLGSGEQSHAVTVYVPPNKSGSEPMPTVYFHDGGLYVQQVPTPQLIEALITANQLEPLIAVFVSPSSPSNRSVEYRGDAAFLEFFNGELIAEIQDRFPVADDPGRRAIIGSSRGGLGALAVAWHKPQPVFGLCGILQPALTPATQILNDVFASDRRELKFAVVAGRYDVRFLGDYYRLLDTLLTKGYPVRSWVSPVGHSHNSWQSDIPTMLRALFPGH